MFLCSVVRSQSPQPAPGPDLARGPPRDMLRRSVPPGSRIRGNPCSGARERRPHRTTEVRLGARHRRQLGSTGSLEKKKKKKTDCSVNMVFCNSKMSSSDRQHGCVVRDRQVPDRQRSCPLLKFASVAPAVHSRIHAEQHTTAYPKAPASPPAPVSPTATSSRDSLRAWTQSPQSTSGSPAPPPRRHRPAAR